MSKASERWRDAARRVLFVAFATCTLWLLVENSILLVVLPHWWADAHRVSGEVRHDHE
jgi:hypothetical protein